MGYTTNFSGELLFNKELTASQIEFMQKMFGENCRDHPEWETSGLYYMDMEFNDSFTGIKHNGAEKTYDFDQLVNVLIKELQKQWPDLKLSGSLIAQGEDIDDRWRLVIGEDGLASRRKIVVTGKRMTCPHCKQEFIVES